MRRSIQRSLLALASTCVALLAGEVAARVLELGPTPPPAAKGQGPTEDSADPALGWEPKPDSWRQWTYRERNGDERVARANVNRHGARGPALELEKPPGTFRIVALGDSFTFGTGVEDGSTWPAALQRFLDRRPELASCEVWNYGVEGYDTTREIRWLSERLLPRGIDPDLVLVGFFFNDVEDGSVKTERLTGWRKFVMSLCNETPEGFPRWLRARSVLAETIAYKVSRRIMTSNWTRNVQGLFEDGFSGWEAVKSALRAGRDLARERGFAYAVVLYPPLWREGEHLASHEAYQRFAAFCAAESIPCVNLDPLLDGLQVEQYWIHPRNHHPTPDCHEIVGEEVGRFLVEAELVPKE